MDTHQTDPAWAINRKNESAAALMPQVSGDDRRNIRIKPERSIDGYLIERLVFDVVVLVLSLPFIILAVLAARLHGAQLSHYGNNVLDTLKLGPTIFPILFTAIVARLMRKVAAWEVERTAPLGFLEQLMASQSLASSIEAICALRSLTPVALLIVFLWALSPLGGQSSLRLLSVRQAPIFGNTPIEYYSTNSTAYIGGSAHYVVQPLAANAIFAASLLALDSIQFSPVDSWNNIKIPAPDVLIRATLENPEAISASWIDVEPGPYQNYSSLVGIVLLNVPTAATANFSIETAFTYTDCHQRRPQITVEQFCAYFGPGPNNGSPCAYYQNGTFIDSLWDEQSFVLTTFSNLTQCLTAKDAPIFMNMQYAVTNYFGTIAQTPLSVFNCTLHNVRVEANVLCDGTTCAVKRIRQSQNDRRPSFLVPWNTDDPGNYNNEIQGEFFSSLLGLLMQATGTATRGAFTPTDNYLYGLDPTFIYGYDSDWPSVSDEAFSRRMMRILNSYWIAAQNPYSISGDIHAKINTIEVNTTNGQVYGSDGTVGYGTNVTNASVTRMVEVYEAHYLWIAILLCISVTLFVCAIVSLALSPFIVAPDILGRVSSLTRDSPHFSPEVRAGGALSGWERARELKNTKVQIADVSPYDPTGNIAFIGAGAEGKDRKGTWRLRRGRTYE